MATMVERALRDVLRPRINATRGVDATYTHASNKVSLAVVVNPTNAVDELESDGSVHRSENTQDFVVLASVLLATPERGDSILWDGRLYLLTHQAGSMVYGSDAYGVSYRLHTIQVPVDAIPIVPPGVPPVTGAPEYGNSDGVSYGNPNGDSYAPLRT